MFNQFQTMINQILTGLQSLATPFLSVVIVLAAFGAAWGYSQGNTGALRSGIGTILISIIVLTIVNAPGTILAGL